MNDAASERDALRTVRSECIELGFQEGMDFHVDGFPTLLSSEHIDLRVASGSYEIRYADMGQKHLVVRCVSFEDARKAFIDQLTRLTAGRNRGPMAGQVEKHVSWRETMTEEELIERFKREQRARREARD